MSEERRKHYRWNTFLGLKKDTVLLVPHNPCWMVDFTIIKHTFFRIMGEDIIAVHHIGSTVIPTIPAKPILDVAVVVAWFEVLKTYQEALEEEGFYYRPMHDKPDRRLFIRGSHGTRTHHIHFFLYDSPALSDHLFFRDYLLSHPETAEQYGRLKKDLASRYPNDRARYTADKEPFILDILSNNMG